MFIIFARLHISYNIDATLFFDERDVIVFILYREGGPVYLNRHTRENRLLDVHGTRRGFFFHECFDVFFLAQSFAQTFFELIFESIGFHQLLFFRVAESVGRRSLLLLQRLEVYFCLCYGTADIASNKAPDKVETIQTEHHEHPVILHANGSQMEAAEMINHTDSELILLESLLGRVPPFYGKPDYRVM